VIDRVQVIAIAVSVVLLMSVLELVRRRKLVEEYSLLWILGSIAILALSVWRGMLDIAARELGIFYPPSLLLMLVIVIVFVGLLSFSVVLSRQRKQIERLMEETAILGAEIRDLRTRNGTMPDGLSSP
jgi:hypothetical protein